MLYVRLLLSGLATFVLALPLPTKNIWFDPPNPTSRTPVTVHVIGDSLNPCGPEKGSAQIHGSFISIGVFIPLTCDPVLSPPIAGGWDVPIDLGLLPAGVYDVMMPTFGVLQIVYAEATLTVGDSSSPLQLFPNVLPTAGGTVQITGAKPACTGRPAVCETPIVLFGDVRAPVLSTTPDRINVAAPPHGAGTLDVSVWTPIAVNSKVAALRYFASGEPADLAFFEPVLFPLFINGMGAFGAQWQTDVVARSDNPFPVIATTAIFGDPKVGFSGTRQLSGLNFPSGHLTYIPRVASRSLFFGSLIRDLSRKAEALGTEIPTVRENDFFDRPFTLVNVPSDERYRVALRVYRIDQGSTDHITSVRVRIRELDKDTDPLVDIALPLRKVTEQFFSAYIGDLLTAYPQLAGKGALRVEVDGLPKQRSAWAFVSVTNNETQQVTIISPQ